MDAVKYPRTFHLPWSPGASSDDKVMADVSALASCGDLVVTEKMDGGNFTMTAAECYSRSPSANAQPWDGPARMMWSRCRWDIPPGWRVVGESISARRSVAYEGLPGPFLVFAVFDETGTLLAWSDIEVCAEALGLPTVPLLGRTFGPVSLAAARAAAEKWWESLDREAEGYVIRAARPIAPEEFPFLVGKFVRAGHVRTADDWRRRDDFALNGFRW